MFKYFIVSLICCVSAASLLNYSSDLGRAIDAKINIPKWKEYIIEVAQEFIYEIEDFGLCNCALNDYIQNSSRVFFGYEVKGTARYTNGFIGSMQGVSIVDNKYMGPVIQEPTQYVKFGCYISLQDITVFYDYIANLTVGNFSGTVGIPLGKIEFMLESNIHYKAGSISVEGNYSALTTADAKDKMWYYKPTNKYLEILNRANKFETRDQIKNIFSTQWINLLNNVLQRIPIPEYYFNSNIKTPGQTI